MSRARCDHCGTEAAAGGRHPEGWATARLVRYGHRPRNYLICGACTPLLDFWLSGYGPGGHRGEGSPP